MRQLPRESNRRRTRGERHPERGGHAIAVQADVSVESDVVRLFDTCVSDCGTLKGLVNNAGILETQMPIQSMGAERLHRVFATNVIGSILCAREAVRRMSVRSGGAGGAIVNLSSMAAGLGGAGEYVDYAASKGAIETLTIGLAKEVAADGIRVNAVRPGVIHTDMHASGGEPGRVDRLKDAIPMKRGGAPEEVAEAILWLLSDAASYTTGSIPGRVRREMNRSRDSRTARVGLAELHEQLFVHRLRNEIALRGVALRVLRDLPVRG